MWDSIEIIFVRMYFLQQIIVFDVWLTIGLEPSPILARMIHLTLEKLKVQRVALLV